MKKFGILGVAVIFAVAILAFGCGGSNSGGALPARAAERVFIKTSIRIAPTIFARHIRRILTLLIPTSVFVMRRSTST
jgi:hypothetical protein